MTETSSASSLGRGVSLTFRLSAGWDARCRMGRPGTSSSTCCQSSVSVTSLTLGVAMDGAGVYLDMVNDDERLLVVKRVLNRIRICSWGEDISLSLSLSFPH